MKNYYYDFGRIHFHPEKFQVLGKLSWNGDKAYIADDYLLRRNKL